MPVPILSTRADRDPIPPDRDFRHTSQALAGRQNREFVRFDPGEGSGGVHFPGNTAWAFQNPCVPSSCMD